MFEDFNQKRHQLLEFMDKIVKYAEDNGQSQTAKDLQGYRDQLESLRYNIAIMGFMKRGKSTLINTLLGRTDDKISPIDVTICTSVISEYVDKKRDGKEMECAEIIYKNGEFKQIGLDEIKNYVTEDNNKKNAKKVHKVVIHGDFPLLNESAIFVDTPGSGTIYDYHDDLVESFLPQADAIIWLTAANNLLEKGEKEFLQSLKEKEKKNIFFVLTKYDELLEKSQDEINETIQDVEGKIAKTGINFKKLYKIYAKNLYDARRDGCDYNSLESIRVESGIAELEKDIESHIRENSNQQKILGERIKETLEHLRNYCNAQMSLTTGHLAQFDKDTQTLEEESKKLEEETATLQKKKNDSLKEFERKWNRAVEKFIRELDSKADPIVNEIENFLDKEGIISKSLKGLALADKIGKKVQSKLQDSASTLSEELEKIANKLHKEINQDVEVYIRKAGDKDIASKAIGMGSLAFVGGATLLGGTTLANTIGGVIAAWGGYASASALASKAGIFTAVKAWFVGSAATPALGTAITTTTAAIMPIILIPAGLFLGYKILDQVTDKSLKAKIPGIVNGMIEVSKEQVTEKLAEHKEHIIKTYNDIVEELLMNKEDQLREIIEAKEKNNPGKRLLLEEKKDRLLALQTEVDNLSSYVQD